MGSLKNFQQANSGLLKLHVNIKNVGLSNAFMKIGDEYEYEKIKNKKHYNGSDEDGTLAQAYTRFDNDNPD